MGQFLTTIKTDGKKQKQRYELAGRLWDFEVAF